VIAADGSKNNLKRISREKILSVRTVKVADKKN